MAMTHTNLEIQQVKNSVKDAVKERDDKKRLKEIMEQCHDNEELACCVKRLRHMKRKDQRREQLVKELRERVQHSKTAEKNAMQLYYTSMQVAMKFKESYESAAYHKKRAEKRRDKAEEEHKRIKKTLDVLTTVEMDVGKSAWVEKDCHDIKWKTIIKGAEWKGIVESRLFHVVYLVKCARRLSLLCVEEYERGLRDQANLLTLRSLISSYADSNKNEKKTWYEWLNDSLTYVKERSDETTTAETTSKLSPICSGFQQRHWRNDEKLLLKTAIKMNLVYTYTIDWSILHISKKKADKILSRRFPMITLPTK